MRASIRRRRVANSGGRSHCYVRHWARTSGAFNGSLQGIDLALDQGKVVDRIEDGVLARVTAWVPGDHFAAATDHDLVDIAADPDIVMAIGDRDRVIVLR